MDALERRGARPASGAEAALHLPERVVLVLFEPARELVPGPGQNGRAAAQKRRDHLDGVGAGHDGLDHIDGAVDAAGHRKGHADLPREDRDPPQAQQELGRIRKSRTRNDLEGLDVQYRVYHGYEIDLTRDENELFAKMTSACRRCVRKAAKEGVIVEAAHDLQFADDYYSQLQDVFAKQRRLPTYDLERVRQLISHMHPTGHLLLLRARDRNGRCIATGIFPHMNGVMYFWGGASWRAFQGLRPNEAVQWEAIKIAKRNGLRTYDMGGGGDYKRKYGGSEIEVPWFRKSKYPWLRYLRELAEFGHGVRQQCFGRLHTVIGTRSRGDC